MTTKNKNALRGGSIQFRPGYAVIVEFSATGGVRYDRRLAQETSINYGDGLRADYETTKTVDHVAAHEEARSIVNAAYHAVRKHCTETAIGYLADDAALAKVRADLEPLQERAADFDRRARNLGTERRVTIEIFPLELRVDDETVARRLARTVSERLADVRGALETGEPAPIYQALQRCRNLPMLATGIQSDAIRMALDHAKDQRRQLMEVAKAGEPVSEAAKLIDLQPLDAAIALFAYDDERQAFEAAS